MLTSHPKVSKIIHLTDLHVGANYNFDQKVLIDGLCNDVVSLHETAFKPEFICFSGDLAYTGNGSTYSDVLGIILRIAESARISLENIIIAPGNHDLDTSVVTERSRDLDSLRNRLSLRDNGDGLILTESWVNYFNNAFKPYCDLSELFSDSILKADAPFYWVYEYSDVYFISINTALVSGTGLPGLGDEGKLYFPEEKLYDAFNLTGDKKPVIVIGHHPLDWLCEKNKARISKLLESRSSAYLFGHVHLPEPSLTKSACGSLLSLQGGALCQGRERNPWSGYSISVLSHDYQSWLLKTKKWYEDRRSFDNALEFGKLGEFTPDPDVWKELLPILDLGAVEQWRSGTLVSALKETIGETVLGESIGNVFVAPEFSYEKPLVNQQTIPFAPRLGTIKYGEIFASDESFLISSAPEMGKTTMLSQLALELAAKPIENNNWKIPVKIEFGSFSPDLNSLKRTIRKNIVSLPHGWNFETLMKSGKFVILIDDFDFNDRQRKVAVADLIRKYENCRYIITTSTPIYDNVGMHPEIVENFDIRTVTFKPLRASGLNALIENSKPNKSISSAVLRERIIKEAEALNMPLTAVTSTFLIQILCTETNERPMNQAALIERYLELLLEKYSKNELELATFNFKNKTDLLSALSEKMVVTGNDFIEEVEVINFIDAYLKLYGLRFSATGIFQHLLRARVLQLKAGLVSFRLRMFFEFFVAHRMSTDTNFYDLVFAEESYVTFPNEISIYCALNLKDEDRIKHILERYNLSFEKVWGAKDATESGGSFLDRFELPKNNSTIEQSDDFSLKDREQNAIEQEHTSLLDSIEFPDKTDQTIYRRRPEEEFENWIAHLLLLGTMVKHLELIPNETKVAVLKASINGWLHFTQYSLGKVIEISKLRRLTINNVTYKSSLPDSMDEIEVARLLSTIMPIAVAKMASLNICTEKLITQISDNIDDPKTSASECLLRFSLLVDVSSKEISMLGDSVLRKVSKSSFLTRAFSLKLYEMAIRHNFAGSQLEDCRRLTAEAAVSVTAGAKKDKVVQKNKIIEGIKRERLLLSFRNNNE